MLRPSRPLTVVLLWLAIVLLPVRAWAAVAMPFAIVGEAIAVESTVDAAAAPHDAAGPCHQDPVDPSGTSGHACGLCGVCHSAMAAWYSAASALPALPEARPRIAPPPGIERPVQDGPDRPPRSVLA